MTNPFSITHGDAMNCYRDWPTPIVIVSDGPYGVGGYDGDLRTHHGLADWYEPHIKEWSNRSSPQTTLWFWNTEVGWAEVHPILKQHGWVYRGCNVWDKGIGHIAGNSNTKTMRKFPVVTEVCAHYIRRPVFKMGSSSSISAQEWMRLEWARTGLRFSESNKACGVKNAATRKYLTGDHAWYFPPPEVFEKLVSYANEHGEPNGRPYFSTDGVSPVAASQWEQFRGKFYCPSGTTNVWKVGALRGRERIKISGKAYHPNQKPIVLMNRIISASSDEGDVVWEPFGGLCSASVAACMLKRTAFAAEIELPVYLAAQNRLDETTQNVFEGMVSSQAK